MQLNQKNQLTLKALFIAAGILWTAACSKTSASAPPPAPEVEVANVEQRDVPIYHEWIGTLDGMVNAAIKAEVTGYLLRQAYTEGSFVQQGQLLFDIDPRPFQAALSQAEGQLAQSNGQLSQAKAQLIQSQAQLVQAQANQVKTQLDADRYAPLAKEEAITQQDLDNATQTNLSAKAQVEAARAQVETSKAQIEAAIAGVEAAKANVDAARVNLGFTKLTSPIDGIAGQAQIQVGNLVNPSSGTITTVSTLNPVKANFTVSEQEYLSFSREATKDLNRLQLESRVQQEALVASLQDRTRLAYVRYRGGVDTLLNALDADRDLFQAELTLSQIRLNELLSVVQLYKALGGGWQ